MALLSWIAAEAALNSAALTVQAQTISPNDVGALYHPMFFPRQNTDSVEIRNIVTTDFRPVADRREWNKRGRKIHQKVPDTNLAQMIPVESTFTVDEIEIQHLVERTFGNEDLFRRMVMASIPDRVNALVGANYRRIEVDAMAAWGNGAIVVRNPEGTTADKTISLGFAGSRYLTAPTAWNNAGLNAYDEFITFMENAVDAIGPTMGAVMRLATFKEIQKDAPKGVMNVQLTREQVRQRIQDDLGSPFQFMVIEDSHDIYTDGGLANTRTKVWPAQKVAAVPAGMRVGSTFYAPVARAFEVAGGAPGAGIDLRSNTVYREVANGARELIVECQVNALAIPDEQKVYVINAGV